MIKRRSQRQQKQRATKVQNESQPQAKGLKRSRTTEERSSKKRKASDDVYGVGKKKSTFEEKNPNKHKDFDDDHDSYCWKCHKYCQDEKCSTCNRVYCFKCFKGHTNQICEACLQQNASEDAFSTIADTSSLLLSVIETSFPEKKIKNQRLFNWQPKATEVKLCHIVDYSYIDSKSKDTDGLQYRSPAELLDDVKWMYHNCVILYGDHHDITNEARKILKQFTIEIEDLSDCAECYRKRFLNICETPHPLIMAKQKSYSPWPAKCLRVLDGRAHVRYFGSHQMAKVPLKDCYFVSKDYIHQKKSKTFEKAKWDFNDYITLFKETFGEDYPYQPKGTSFDVDVGQDLMKRVKEKYQRAQKASRTSTSSRVIDLTEDDYGDSKGAVPVISEGTGQSQLQPSDDSDNASFLNAVGNSDINYWKQIEHMLTGFTSTSNFPTSGSQSSIFSPGPYDSQTRNIPWLLPPNGSSNESGISISNVYSGSDPHSLSELDLSAQDTSFLINDPSHGIQTVPNFGMPSSYTTTEAENNNRGDTDDDIQVIEELSSDTQHRGVNFKNIDEKLVQVILCRDPAAYSILKAANDLVRQLFIQFWGIANGIKNAPAILSAQEEKIKKLKKDKAELLSKCDDRVANADSILRSIYAMKCDALQQKNKDLEEKLNKIAKDLEFYKNSLNRYHEAANDFKKDSYCAKDNCNERASIFCCNNNNGVTIYCSPKCQKEHESIHYNFCSRGKQNSGEYQNQPSISTASVLEISKCSKTVEKITVEVIPNGINFQQQPLY